MSKFTNGPTGGLQTGGPTTGGFRNDDYDDEQPLDLDAATVTPFPARQPAKAAGPSNTQVLVWSLLGIGALGYLAVSNFAPDFIRAQPAEATTTATLADTRAQVDAISGEVASLRQSVDEQAQATSRIVAQIEQGNSAVEELRRQVSGVANQSRALDERLATVEAGKGGSKQSNRLVPVQPATTQKVAVKPEATPETQIDGLVVDDPAPIAAKPAAKAVPPTSLVPKAATAAEAEPAPARTYGVQLAESASPEALRLNWELLAEQHSGALKGLKAKTAGRGSKYRLVAGPFASSKQASAACAKFVELGMLGCQPVEFSGNPIP